MFCRQKPAAQTKTFERVFVGYARIWVFAVQHSIESLADLFLREVGFRAGVLDCLGVGIYSRLWGSRSVYIYGNSTTVGSQLRRLVAGLAACVVEDVCDLDGWSALLSEAPDFATDLIKADDKSNGLTRKDKEPEMLGASV